MSSPELVSLADVRDAARRLEGVIQPTPLESSRALSAAAGVEVLLKCEHLQRTGAFKLRGAYNRVAQLGAAERERGVACASAGNHAQGVALSAALAGVPATVFMPRSAPLPKVAATRGYGAEVRLVGEGFAAADAACRQWAGETGALVVPAFDDPAVIAGQGTVGLELLDAVPELGTVVVAAGGGGLLAGIAVAVRALRPQARIIGVQAAGAAALPEALRAGGVRTLAHVETIADGIAVAAPGALPLAHVQALVDEVVTVSDEAIARAVLLLVERGKQVVEPAGAAGVAALLAPALADRAPLPEPVVVVLSGGNVDPLLLLRIMHSGLGEEGRYFAFRTRLADRPGALSRLLGLLAEHDANVVEIEHRRYGAELGLLEAEVRLEIETRGPEHITALAAALAAEGYEIGAAGQTGPGAPA